jgi:DNA-binding CsgD family transcriptional regulator
VVHAAGVQAELDFAFAGLHQVCAPLLDRLDALPPPQANALATAFGVSGGEPPDRFLVGLAVLGLLSAATEEEPVLCVVDDAHWLDEASSQSLAFVARRLEAESVGLVFAERSSETRQDLAGLPELALEGLAEPDARALLDSAVAGPLDARIRDRIVSETHGNPLALLELPRGLSIEQLAGGFGLPAVTSLSGRLETSFAHRVEALPPPTRRLLVVAAAEPLGEPLLLWRAAARLDIPTDAGAPAVEAGLLELGARVRFRHSLVRSAVYGAAPADERRAAHAALAEATDPEVDPDHRAWHRAHAAAGPDEDVAADLERSAERAQSRGGPAAAGAFLERAVDLTVDPVGRARRALMAAQAKQRAGVPEAALALLAAAEGGPLGDLERAQAQRLRGQIAFAMTRGAEAPGLLVDAARRLESLDPSAARETYLEALTAAQYAGRLAVGVGLVEVARAARALPPPDEAGRAVDLILDAYAAVIADGYAAGAPLLRRAVDAFRERTVSDEEETRWLSPACHGALVLWDYDSWRALSARQLQLARASGALTVLPIALSTRLGVYMNGGEFDRAEALLGELAAVTAATGTHLPPYGPVSLTSWRGSDDSATAAIESARQELEARGEGMGLTFMDWVISVRANAHGRYDDALAAARRAHARPEELWSTLWLHELVEAAARSGEDALARDTLDELAAMAQISGTDWALGIEARCRALLSEGETAEALYREAIERLGRTALRVALARAHLLYGEWLRRERRRADARVQLRTADDLFTEMGVDGFGVRARRDLRATGETARQRTVETRDDLTAQEAQIAQLARDGLSNPEIGARLFISPRTVEYHLHKVFGKLDISSRAQLEGALLASQD